MFKRVSFALMLAALWAVFGAMAFGPVPAGAAASAPSVRAEKPAPGAGASWRAAAADTFSGSSGAPSRAATANSGLVLAASDTTAAYSGLVLAVSGKATASSGMVLAASDKASDKTSGKASGKASDKGVAASGTSPAKPAPTKPAKKAVITDVQVYSGQAYSRIVLVLSGEAARKGTLLPPDPKDGGLRRFYLDLENTVIKPGVPSRFDVSGDVARKVRLSYFSPDVSRLVVEVENLKSHQVFVLENPYRVIVDVQGEAATGAVGKTAKDSAAERKAEPRNTPADAGKAAGARGKAASGPEGQTAVAGEAERSAAAGRDRGKDSGGKSADTAVVKGQDSIASGKAASGKAASGSRLAALEDKPGSPGVRFDTPGKRKMAKQLVEQLGLTVRTVMIDPGHGGRDSGARGPGGLLEKNVNLRVAQLLGRELTRMGFEVLYTRTTDKYVPLEARTAMANAREADLFVSIHCNAHADAKASGMETYSLNLASTPDEVRVAARENSVDPRRISDMQKILDDLMHASKLAQSRDFAKSAHQATLAQARKSIALRDRGVHEAPFYVLLGARMPAILVEVGYITNPAEAAKLKDETYLEGLARGIAQGVAAYKERIERFAQKNN